MLQKRVNLCFLDNVTKAVATSMSGDLGIKSHVKRATKKYI